VFFEYQLPKKAILNLLWEHETHLGLKPDLFYLGFITYPPQTRCGSSKF
jgi:hypothetical protein